MSAPAVTPDPRMTVGDLLTALLAAFTTCNANQEQLLDRIERLEAQVKELSLMTNV